MFICNLKFRSEKKDISFIMIKLCARRFMPNVYDTFAITVHRIELTIINNTIMYPSKFNSTVS